MADPASVTNMQRMAKAGFLQGFLGKGLNDEEILKRIFEAADIADIEKLFPPKPEGPPTPNPLMIADLKEKESKAALNEATATKNRADAMDKLSLVAERGVMNGSGGMGPVAQQPGYDLGNGGAQEVVGGPAPGMG